MSNKINKFINYKDYNLSINSQKVKKNDIFFAIQGTKDSGNNYINEAIKKKSSVIVSDKKITNYKSVRVKNVRKFLAKICSLKYFNKPKNIIAVTGTNGKSSVAHYHYQILKLNNISSSSIGTLGIFYNNYDINLLFHNYYFIIIISLIFIFFYHIYINGNSS